MDTLQNTTGALVKRPSPLRGRPRTRKDLTGQVFGRLTLIAKIPDRWNEPVRYECLCECGTSKVLVGRHIIDGRTTSCGCRRKEMSRGIGTRLGQWVRANRQFPPRLAVARSLWSQYRGNAKTRNLEFSITRAYVEELVYRSCHYCGIGPSKVHLLRTGASELYNGIDRIQNERGYVPGNCVTCCYICNQAKHSQTHAAFMEWIRRMTEKWKDGIYAD